MSAEFRRKPEGLVCRGPRQIVRPGCVGWNVLKAHVPTELGEQKAADLSRDPDPMLQPVMQIVTQRQHRGVRDLVAELGSPISQVASKTKRFADCRKATGHRKSLSTDPSAAAGRR